VLTQDRTKHRAYKPEQLRSMGPLGPHCVTGAGVGPHGTWVPTGPLGELLHPTRCPIPACTAGVTGGPCLLPRAGCEEGYREAGGCPEALRWVLSLSLTPTPRCSVHGAGEGAAGRRQAVAGGGSRISSRGTRPVVRAVLFSSDLRLSLHGQVPHLSHG